jgi:mRNA interferase MazF
MARGSGARAVIRGGIYEANFGQAKRGFEQRGERFAVVMSRHPANWSVVLVVPTSTGAQAAIFRPEVEVVGRQTRLLVDQMRAIDTRYLGRNVGFLDRIGMAELEHTIAEYLGLMTT